MTAFCRQADETTISYVRWHYVDVSHTQDLLYILLITIFPAEMTVSVWHFIGVQVETRVEANAPVFRAAPVKMSQDCLNITTHGCDLTASVWGVPRLPFRKTRQKSAYIQTRHSSASERRMDVVIATRRVRKSDGVIINTNNVHVMFKEPITKVHVNGFSCTNRSPGAWGWEREY